MAKKKNSVTVLDVVRGLSQAAANAYDGAHMENYSPDGEVRTAGLQREEGDPIIDKRVIDGFGVKFMGPILCINYQTEVQLKEVYAAGFETEMEQRLADIVKYLKKEYKKVTGDTLTLTADGEMDAIVQNTSRVRSWVQASKWYKIGGIGDVEVIDEARAYP